VEVVLWLEVVVIAETVEVLLVCVDVKVMLLIICEDVVKSTLTFAPVSVTVLVNGPNPGPDAVIVIEPDVPIGMA